MSKANINKTIFHLGIFLTTCLAFPKITAAQIDLSIDPAVVRIQAKPGKAITKAFTIENRSSQSKELVVRLIPFNKSDINGNPNLDVKTTSPWQKYFSLSNTNIKFDEPFEIKSKSTEQIILSISIPENSNVEDLYTTLLVSTYNNTLPTTNEGSQIGASIGANLLITITPELNPKTILRISSLKITNTSYFQIGQIIFVDSLSPIKFKYTATNEGNHLTESKGTVTISKGNETLSVQGILPQYILKNNTRQILDLYGNSEFTFQPNMLSIGRYKFNVHIKSDNTNSQNSQDIYIVPAKIILGSILALILIRFSLKIAPKKVDTLS